MSWGQRRHWILSCPSVLEKNIFIFLRPILPLVNISSDGDCGGCSFHAFLFSYFGLGLWCSGGCMIKIFRGKWWLTGRGAAVKDA